MQCWLWLRLTIERVSGSELLGRRECLEDELFWVANHVILPYSEDQPEKVGPTVHAPTSRAVPDIAQPEKAVDGVLIESMLQHFVQVLQCYRRYEHSIEAQMLGPDMHDRLLRQHDVGKHVRAPEVRRRVQVRDGLPQMRIAQVDPGCGSRLQPRL